MSDQNDQALASAMGNLAVGGRRSTSSDEINDKKDYNDDSFILGAPQSRRRGHDDEFAYVQRPRIAHEGSRLTSTTHEAHRLGHETKYTYVQRPHTARENIGFASTAHEAHRLAHQIKSAYGTHEAHHLESTSLRRPQTAGEYDAPTPSGLELFPASDFDYVPIDDNECTLPAAREARRLGLELDFEPILRMQAESEADDRIVREYKDVHEGYYASRAARPIYDGTAVTQKVDTSSPPTREPIGQWHCCKCDNKHDVYQHDQGEHIIKFLSCICSHFSCEGCNLTGSIKMYKPLLEPIPVPMSDDSEKILFGTVCGNCGLSWRAQPVRAFVKDKLTAVQKDLAKLRHAKSGLGMRGESSGSTSSSNLNLRTLSSEMEKEFGKQASSALVKFSGIVCTCGSTINNSVLCFQVVEEVAAPQPSFTATAEDRAQGIGKATLTLGSKGKRVRQANPLMSNPV
jgi:hypothetical protein